MTALNIARCGLRVCLGAFKPQVVKDGLPGHSTNFATVGDIVSRFGDARCELTPQHHGDLDLLRPFVVVAQQGFKLFVERLEDRPNLSGVHVDSDVLGLVGHTNATGRGDL